MTDAAGRLAASLAQPFVDPTSRTFWPWLLIAAALALALTRRRARGIGPWIEAAWAPSRWWHPSSRADLALLAARRLLAALGLAAEPGLALAVGLAVARALDRALGIPEVGPVPAVAVTAGYTAVLFVAWDASRYAVHRAMHAVPALWALHQVHHSAEVLTPLTFHRVHPIEAAIQVVRGAVVGGGLAGVAFWLFRGDAHPWTVLGAHGIGVVLNAVFGNLRHSHLWWSFGPAVERWALSPAQHQLHHAEDPALQRSNYGTWLAIWDRLGGTLVLADAPPARFGVQAGERNHDPHDLGSLLVRPVLAAVRAVPRGLTWLVLLIPGAARAQEDGAEAPVYGADEPAYEVIVEAPEGVPRVTGSAYRLDEAQLDRFEYDNIDEVLALVPGVYVRTEDGLGLRPNIGMRGGNPDRSARIALMEDGVPFAPAPYAAPAAYYFPMVTRMVAVEVFKGPASIRHGPQTIGGALNLVTRDVPDAGADGAIDVALGPRKSASAHGWFGAGDGRTGWLVEGSHLSTAGFKHLDTGGPTSVNRQDLMLKGRAGDVELKLGYGHEDSYETYLGLSAEDFAKDPLRRYAASDGDHMTWHRTQAELSWQGRLGDRVTGRAVAYHHFLDRSWFKLNRFRDGPDLHDLLAGPAGGQAEVFLGILRGEVDSTTPGQSLMRGTNARTFHSGGLQGLVSFRSGGQAVYHELEVGARLHADRVRRRHDERGYAMVDGVMVPDGSPLEVTLDSRTLANAAAVYVHDELSAGPWEVHPGVRTELVQTAAGDAATGPVDPVFRAVVLPGLGLLWSPHGDLDLFAGAHRGFSPVPPGAPRSTRPETAWNFEAGTRLTPGAVHAEATAFLSDYLNLAGQCTLSAGCAEDQLDQQFDAGAATIWGMEALFRDRLPLPGRMALSPELSYTLTRAWFRTAFTSDFPQFGRVEPGDFLPYLPTHQGAAQAALEHDRFAVSAAATGRSAMRDEAGQDEAGARAVPGVVTVDLAGSVELDVKATLYATVTNLFDATPVASWRPFGARPIPPRQWMAGVKGRW